MKTTKKRKRPPQPPQAAIWDCDVLEYGDILDGWRIDAFLSKGGFGAVYHAVACDDPDRVAAVKIFSGDVDDDANHGRERIHTEKMLIEKMGSTYAPALYGFGEKEGRPYIIMEYLDAIDPDAGGLPESDAEIRAFFLQLLEAVGRLHAMGWLHCDIKPANIARRYEDGRIVLIDFGTAHKIEREVEHVPTWNTMNTCHGNYVIVGTRGYAPPELCFQPCRDVYALGHVLRDCFKAEVPFEWSMVINKCISCQPRYRYANVDAFKHDIADLNGLKLRTYVELRKQKIMEQRRTERSLLKAANHVRKVDWHEIRSFDKDLSSKDQTVFRVSLERRPATCFVVEEPWVLPENAVVIVTGPGVLKAHISGPPSSIIVLRWYASLNNISTECPPKNELLYAIVGPGSYLNFPNIKEKDRARFFMGKSKRRIFRDMDATTAFRFGGPDVFSEVEQQTLDGLESSDLPLRYREKLKAFFKGESFSVIPDKV